VVYTVRVQVPFLAPTKEKRTQVGAFFFCRLRFALFYKYVGAGISQKLVKSLPLLNFEY
jgi:hypothetical protein